jgi:hypothetical protein
LTADGAAFLPVAGVAGPDGSVTGQVGQQVTATGVAVQSVTADEGSWVGTGGRLVAHDGGFAGVRN